MKPKPHLTIKELAKAWGFSPRTIWRRVASGDIKAINVAPKGALHSVWRIPLAEAQRPGMLVGPLPVMDETTASDGSHE